jgi:carboxyl-terminal processing protease
MKTLFLVMLMSTSSLAAATIRPGIWKSVGYGELVVADSERFTIYDVTSHTCVQRDSYLFADEKNPYYPSVEYPEPDRMLVEGNYYRYALERVEDLPAPCSAVADLKDPLLNFDVFWETFDENYAGFGPRDIDWNAVRTQYRSRIGPQTSEKELYGLLGEIVQEINDPHVFVTNQQHGADELFSGSRDVHGIARALSQAAPGHEEAFYRHGATLITNGIDAVVRYELLQDQFETAFNDRLTWGMLARNVGYLRASQFFGLFPGMARDEMYSALEKKLDEVFSSFSTASALVIDISTNTGGAEFIANAIARRIIREPTVVWSSRYRTPRGFSEDRYDLTLEPSPAVRFNGPVVVLMSNNSVSAGEKLGLLLQGAPGVTLVGETTPGALSDMLMKALPNGGLFALPNEWVIAANGATYDGRGIPPDVDMVVFDPHSPLSKYGQVVEEAATIALGKTAPSR